MNGFRLCLFLLVSFLILAGCTSATISPTAESLPPSTETLTVIPGTATPVETEFIASKAEDILGLWSFSSMGNSWRIRFLTNGTIRTGPLAEPNKFLHGTFTFNGTIVQVDEPTCGLGSYEAHVIQHDGQNYKLYFKVIEDTCSDRVREMTKGYKWVGP